VRVLRVRGRYGAGTSLEGVDKRHLADIMPGEMGVAVVWIM
jgi:hypothetical protein